MVLFLRRGPPEEEDEEEDKEEDEEEVPESDSGGLEWSTVSSGGGGSLGRKKLVSIKSYFLKVAKQPLWIILSLFLKVCSGSNGPRAIGRIRYIFLG